MWLIGLKFITSSHCLQRSLTHTLHIRKEPQTELPASCILFLWSELILYKKVLRVKIQWMGWRSAPSNQSCATVSPFASLLINQNLWNWPISALWTNQTVRICILHLLKKWTNQEPEVGILSVKANPSPSVSAEWLSCISPVCKLRYNTQAALPESPYVRHLNWAISQLSFITIKLFLLNKVPPVLHPKLGTPVGIELAAVTFGWHQ